MFRETGRDNRGAGEENAGKLDQTTLHNVHYRRLTSGHGHGSNDEDVSSPASHRHACGWRNVSYTVRAVPCSILCRMERSGYRLNVTLDPEHAARLARLAERTHVQEGTLARSLLSTAIEDADPDARNIVEVLDGIPGAYERAMQSLDRARRGETISLDEL